MPVEDVLIVTSYPPAWDRLAAITCATMFKYAQKNGYAFHADRSDLRDNYWNPHTQKNERLPIRGFRKMDLLLHYLPLYKVVVWIDADALVTNPAIRVEALLEDHLAAGIIMPYDHNTHNATVIVSRSTDLVWDFWWVVNNSGRKMYLRHDWYEMEASFRFSQAPPYLGLIEYESVKRMCGILTREYEPYLPRRVSDKYAWAPGDWILHLSALHIDKRIELAAKYAEELALL